MDKKYVIQAFDLNLKGRFDVLTKYYGNYLFEVPALIMVQQIKDELGITIQEHAIYNLKRRAKNKNQLPVTISPVTVLLVNDPTHLGENG